MTDQRTPVVLVCGWQGDSRAVAQALQREGTTVVHHDLSEVSTGVVRRTLMTTNGVTPREKTTILELAHGCVSCTLREDLLPLLRRLHTRSRVERIVLLIDPVLEPEALSWAIEHVIVSGMVGHVDGPAGQDIRVDATVTCIDAATWLSDAMSDDTLDERGIVASNDDDRTVAQVVVGQADFADAIVISGEANDGWEQAKLNAVLARLAPGAPVAWTGPGGNIDAERLLANIPAHSRRGEITDAHSPMLRGEPPLDSDCGVQIVEFSAQRPFHPERLHESIDTLLDGVICTRGRFWVASQPDQVLWMESAGGGLRIAASGLWLDAMTPEQQAEQNPERHAIAALRWDPRFGDRDCSMAVLVHDADPQRITEALQSALLTDEELALGEAVWATWEDPFGQWHEDPCDELAGAETVDLTIRKEGH
ncbi:ribosome hibernation factor-recruiting GTPase MRF [Hoyosella altamirensis]|uniref:G3E family GTPase n=1 Tax=Hoyosella altamirensis TaxID=616997 RepID=A0A839RHK9_9ACTN|nr:GTP-binding protein [Hoyosella altamirensis]MBB3035867.1 G3E family GTPase [Hoyosella altamirensis]